jgi:hypothetical protein
MALSALMTSQIVLHPISDFVHGLEIFEIREDLIPYITSITYLFTLLIFG